MVGMQVGVDDAAQFFAAQRVPHQRHGLRGMHQVAGVHQHRAFAAFLPMQQHVVR